MTPILRVSDVTVRYGKVPAVTGATLTLEPGSLVALVGPNGAGKSTLTKTVMGRLGAAAGVVEYDGQTVRRGTTRSLMKRGLVLVPEGRHLIADLSVEDNLRLGGIAKRWRGADSRDLSEVYEIFPALYGRRKVKAGMLSGGEQQMAAVGRALVSHPRLLVLDEPSLGLAPVIVQQLFSVLAGLNRDGMTILVVEQNVRDTLSLATEAYVMISGRIVAHGSSEELVAEGRMEALYLMNEKGKAAREEVTLPRI